MNKIKIILCLVVVVAFFCHESKNEDNKNTSEPAGAKDMADKQKKNKASIVNITRYNIEQYLKESENTLLIVKFYTPWCGPCKQMKSGFKQLAEEFSAYIFAEVNVDAEEELSERYNIFSIPTIVFVKNGKIIVKTSGYQSKQALRDLIDQAVQA